MSPNDCDHVDAHWDPVKVEYDSDGTAHAVWQDGYCTCGAVLQLDYNAEHPRVVSEREESMEEVDT